MPVSFSAVKNKMSVGNLMMFRTPSIISRRADFDVTFVTAVCVQCIVIVAASILINRKRRRRRQYWVTPA